MPPFPMLSLANDARWLFADSMTAFLRSKSPLILESSCHKITCENAVRNLRPNFALCAEIRKIEKKFDNISNNLLILLWRLRCKLIVAIHPNIKSK